ncbi:response regulator transcription factor [Blastococcus sp. TML/M2B]|uniref:response regulator transcription factor n=1 Tax=unclassified Blastococcus TaxID=2619396 RepID=UPI001909DC26|nr:MULTISPECIES: response regulator transcription factor [unclassified Blastococcus]MBN1093136.1 response regulator transcription factor [Blastococcus sp. TML/M2B]MBN1096744.1 response regulator transcription factor [Blastococcus sp. TML/C7B]
MTGSPVLLVDDHALFAQSVQIGLRAAGIPADRVTARTASGILAGCAAAAPATVLLDLRLGTGDDGVPIDGLDLVEPVTATGCRVVVVTGETEDATWGTAVERGAVTVLSKDCALDELVAVVAAVRDGRAVLDEGRRQDLLAAARRAHADEESLLAPFRSLSPREDEVLRALAAGLPAAAIAAAGYVSEATVRTQIRAVLTKLRVSSQLQAVALARRAGWLDAPASRDPR